MRDNPVWRDEMPKIILSESTVIDKDLVDSIFNEGHELGLDSGSIKVVEREAFIPLYIDMINYTIRGLKHNIPQFKDLQEIDEQKLRKIAQDYDSYQKNEVSQRLLFQIKYTPDEYKKHIQEQIDGIKNRKVTDMSMYPVLMYCIFGTFEDFIVNNALSQFSKQDQTFVLKLMHLNSIPTALKLSGKSAELPQPMG